jgi:2-haloacid dehalogenase
MALQAPTSAPEAIFFDVYGTLIDLQSTFAPFQPILGKIYQPFMHMWRQKQLEYSWLRAAMESYTDFWHLTGDALDYTMQTFGIHDPALRSRCMQTYLTAPAYEDAAKTLQALQKAQIKTGILTNGNVAMVMPTLKKNSLYQHLDKILSVAAAKTFKPKPETYQLACTALNLPASHIGFVSSNPWDVAGASHFGFRVYWINRQGILPDMLPSASITELTTLADLPLALP